MVEQRMIVQFKNNKKSPKGFKVKHKKSFYFIQTINANRESNQHIKNIKLDKRVQFESPANLDKENKT